MTANALGYAGNAAVVSVAALLASQMLANDTIAGLPAAAGTLGTAIIASPLAQRSKRRGRRVGILFGYSLAMVGCGAAFVAGQIGAFWLLVIAMSIAGAGAASNLQNRFAATDLAPAHERARSIAMVVWVGTIGSVLGTPTALWANRIGMGLGATEWATPMLLGIVGFGLAGAVVTIFLRPDPLELAGGVDPEAPRNNPFRGVKQSLAAVWPNVNARLALVAMAVSQGAMVAVMVMTPLHMKDHGQAELSILVIAIHVLGMFGFSPLVGRFADRFGRVRALQTGALILGAGTVLAVAFGYVPTLIFAGLFLLGLGWSFALIAGSALLTESLPFDQRVPAQGLSDVLMSLSGAVAALSSGFVKELLGYHWLANAATFAAVFILIGATRVRSDKATVVIT